MWLTLQNRLQLSPRMASLTVDQTRNEGTVLIVKSSLIGCCEKARTDSTEVQQSRFLHTWKLRIKFGPRSKSPQSNKRIKTISIYKILSLVLILLFLEKSSLHILY